jgi:hypothetical protein
MANNKIPPSLLNVLLPVLLGSILFFAITGGKVLDPSYVDWLMEGDPATHWQGWQFFRNSPLWQWPLGANPDYGMEMGSSIVFTDSIPLLAFIFKPLTSFLPDTFQYMGLWLFLCFVLQALFAWKLQCLFTNNKVLLLFGSAFFVFAPIMLWRTPIHFALSAHWLLLAGLYFYFGQIRSNKYWLILLGVAALVHAYLLLMLLVIWGADLLQRYWAGERRFGYSAFQALGIILLLGILLWSAGYFMMGARISASGFGFYHMNLLALFDGNVLWSKVLPDLAGGEGDLEGFNYLGIGMIGLGVVAMFLLLRYGIRIGRIARYVPILLACVFFLLFALSNHISLGAYEIASYDLPKVINKFATTFRISGRFFWPVYYIVFLVILYLVFTRLKKEKAMLLSALFLAIQVFDISDALADIRKKLSHSPVWESYMTSDMWENIAKRYDNVIYVLPEHKPEQWLPLSEYASTHKMAINIGYFARKDYGKIQAMRSSLTTMIKNSELDQNSVYIFDDDHLWQVASGQLKSEDLAMVLDGFRVVLPDYKKN